MLIEAIIYKYAHTYNRLKHILNIQSTRFFLIININAIYTMYIYSEIFLYKADAHAIKLIPTLLFLYNILFLVIYLRPPVLICIIFYVFEPPV